jgi:hypothetical protein
MKIIDVHGHLGRWPFPSAAAGARDALALMDRCGIERCIFSSALAIVHDMREGNRELENQIRGERRLHGYVVLNPNDVESSCQELDRYYRNPQFVGAKIHMAYSRQSGVSDGMRSLLREVARRGKPVLIHPSGDLRALCKACADTEGLAVIIAHGGGREGMEIAARTPNIYLEFCSSFPARDKIEEAFRRVDNSRLLFGTDLTLIDPALTLGMAMDAEISEEQRRLMLWDNAAALFGIG